MCLGFSIECFHGKREIILCEGDPKRSLLLSSFMLPLDDLFG